MEEKLQERDLQQEQPTVVAEGHRIPHGAAMTNRERADVESWKKKCEGITEKLTGDTGKPDFEVQLKELDAEIAGKADMGGNMKKVLKTKELESKVKKSADQMDERRCKAALGCHEEKLIKARELVPKVKVSDNKKGDKGGEDLTYGLGNGPRCSGLHGILGQDEANYGLVDIKLVDIKNSLAQVKEPQASHVGLKTFGAAKLGYNKKTKSPTRKKSHAHAKKFGKEIVGENTSKEQKSNAMADITRMEVEEENVGPKRKARAPLEETMESSGVGKKPKLEAESDAFGKVLATQMGSAAAAVQPRREQ